MLEHRLNLSLSDAGKPLEKFVNARAVFQVLKERSNWNSRTLEYLATTQLFSVAQGGGTG